MLASTIWFSKNCFAILLITILACPPNCWAQDISANDVFGAASDALSKFSPLSIATDSLMQNAIAAGNNDLKARLDQTNAIIQSAIFNLNQVLRERVQDLDQKTRIQRMEAIRDLDRLSVNISNTLEVSLNQLDKVLSQNIAGFQNALANSFASLPIPTEPLLNISPRGLTLIANASGPTLLFLTGSGLFKDGRQPEAWVHAGSNDKTGTKLTVVASSMGLLTCSIPSELIPSDASPKELTLSLGFYKGWREKPVWPSFPLTLCGALPRYSVKATMIASDGAYWEKDVTPQQWFYVDSSPHTITASEVVQMLRPDWTVDVDRPGTHGGLSIVWNPPTSPGGSGEHSEEWHGNAFTIWVGGHGGNNSHAFAFAAVKRVSPVSVCGTSQQTKNLQYSGLNQINFQTHGSVLGNCDVSLKTPNVKVVLEVMRQNNTIETVNLPVPTQNKTVLDGRMSLSVDSEGLLNIKIEPSCTQAFSYRIVDQ